jgi:hypothetical protein
VAEDEGAVYDDDGEGVVDQKVGDIRNINVSFSHFLSFKCFVVDGSLLIDLSGS